MSTLIEQQKAISSGSHALVIGSSMAGLVAARVLLNHFDHVTVVERDHLPQVPEPRPGVPQASHVHVLLIQGQQILEQLFPGLEAELIAAGAPLVDWTADFPWLNVWGWASRFPSNLVSLTCSRSLLEWLVCHRLNTYPNLQFLQACQVKGLMANDSKSRVTGVKLHFRDEPHEAELAADLVVDASGRNSQMPKWLEALDYPPPSETVINSFLGYSTRWYERPENFQADWKLLVVSYKPPHDPHGGVLYLVEKNRWAVTLMGIGRDYPPTDEVGFLEFVRNLRSPVIYEAIKDARPISPIYGYRRTENCWRHYEKLSRLPEGLVALGDAVCAFNPVYGQGMTTAALGAITLDRCLHQKFQRSRSLTSLTQHFQKQLAHVLETPWLMATSDDFRWDTTEGGKPNQMTQLMHRYMDQVLLLAVDHPEVHQTFIEVMHMLKPPAAMFRPGILRRVLGQVVNWRTNAASISPELTVPRLLTLKGRF